MALKKRGPYKHVSRNRRRQFQTESLPSRETTCLTKVLPIACAPWQNRAAIASRDFGTACTCRRPRIATIAFSRSRPTEAAFVFLRLGMLMSSMVERPPTQEVARA